MFFLFGKLLPVPMSSILFPLSLLLDLVLRSLIDLDLSFIQCDRYRSICILLHADIQLDQYHILKMLSFFSFYGFGFFVKIQVSIGMCVYFSVFSLIPLIKLSVSIQILGWFFVCLFFCHYCSIVHLEVRSDYYSRSS